MESGGGGRTGGPHSDDRDDVDKDNERASLVLSIVSAVSVCTVWAAASGGVELPFWRVWFNQ